MVTREARRESAAALPRPSATLSARLAKRTVAQSQSAIWISNPNGRPATISLIAEALAGTAERFDVLASLPSRPFPGGKWLRRPLATLGLLYYALKDRLG